MAKGIQGESQEPTEAMLMSHVPFDFDSVVTVLGNTVSTVNGFAAPIEAVKALVALAKFVDRSPTLEKCLEDSRAASTEATAAAAHAACLALAAILTKTAPTPAVIDKLAREAHSGPGAPFRMWRLLGETAKSASHDRRVFLASFFYSLPFTKVREDERDRIDMLVERLMPDDVALLKRIADLETRVPDPRQPSRLIANYPIKTDTPQGTWVASSQYRETGFSADAVALTSLVMHGCISDSVGFWGEAVAVGGAETTGTMLVITPLGQILVQAFEDVRPVIEAALSHGGYSGPARRGQVHRSETTGPQ